MPYAIVDSKKRLHILVILNYSKKCSKLDKVSMKYRIIQPYQIKDAYICIF